MFKRCLILTVIIFVMHSCNSHEDTNDILIEHLDNVIGNCNIYDNKKTERIDSLRQLLAVADGNARKLELYNRIFNEYESFVCDSALYYINVNIELACKTDEKDWICCLLIKKADLVAKAGLFTEALEILSQINSQQLSDRLKDNYYQTYVTTYQYMTEYADNSEYVTAYNVKIRAYRDSILEMPNADPFVYDTEYGTRLIEDGRRQEAIEFFRQKLENYEFATREYSVIASLLAHTYMSEDDKQYEHYLALSALSDIEGSVKENLALRSLAEFRFGKGDVHHAYNYLKKSLEDANFFSARMRKNQVANVLPLAIDAYEAIQQQMQLQLKTYIIAISALVVGLIVSVFFIIKQLRTVSRSLRLVAATKDKLFRLNEELQSANAALNSTNTALNESSRIKEAYIGKFMELCSNYISTLEQYRKKLYQQAASSRIEDLYKSLRSTILINDTLKDFYTSFDSAFLNIFPNFVEQFNALLPEEERIILKEDEKLNTELRVFALIRLGINDSAKIAKFLRCSIATIHTYRSKRKKRSLNPADFNNQIMKIAVFQP